MISYAEVDSEGIVDKLHQSNVVSWLKGKSGLIKSAEIKPGSKFLIDGRHWYLEKYTDDGGFVLKSDMGRYLYRVKYTPHRYGQIGGINLTREKNSVLAND